MPTPGWFVVLALGLVACAGGRSSFPPDSVARPAAGAPSRFLFDGASFNPDEVSRHSCRSPMLDPGDNTKVLLVRAVGNRRGDYEVAEGRYGVNSGELLRLDCVTGGVVGIVPR